MKASVTPALERSSNVASPAPVDMPKNHDFSWASMMVKSSDMVGFRRHVRDELARTTSVLLARVQRLEEAQAEIRARLKGQGQLRVLTARIAAAAQVAPVVGSAIERFAEAMRAPLPRGRAAGLARPRTAWRYFDGTFMPESERRASDLEEYERYAAGGRARAASAVRNEDGKFIAGVGGEDAPRPQPPPRN
jgi:hypothetical protein